MKGLMKIGNYNPIDEVRIPYHLSRRSASDVGRTMPFCGFSLVFAYAICMKGIAIISLSMVTTLLLGDAAFVIWMEVISYLKLNTPFIIQAPMSYLLIEHKELRNAPFRQVRIYFH
ncbi:2-succinyl-5-enolpyruvyl-6-hydroxy-3-cyclohexene-1-carboxylate synthase, partial [Frankliniella fusca]